MHPNVRRESPGMCPECGMALVPTKKKPVRHTGHGEVGREEFDKSSICFSKSRIPDFASEIGTHRSFREHF